MTRVSPVEAVEETLRRIAARVTQPLYALGDTVAVTAMLAFSVLNIAAGSYSTFLYFRF